MSSHGLNGPLVVTNCLLAGNTAYIGGAISTSEETTLVNCTVVDNEATAAVGGYLGPDNSDIENCIFWGNTDPLGDEQISVTGSAVVEYSDVEGGFTGTGNIDDDPLFISGTNYRLTSVSPCINIGRNGAVPGDALDVDLDMNTMELTPDRDLNERVAGYSAGVDMGAWEHQCPEDTNGDGEINVDDLIPIILAWNGSNEAADVNNDGVVDVDDLLGVILRWGLCPGESGSEPPSLEDEVEDAGLDYPDDWDDFMNNLNDENYRCWMERHLHGCQGLCASCPGADPYN